MQRKSSGTAKRNRISSTSKCRCRNSAKTSSINKSSLYRNRLITSERLPEGRMRCMPRIWGLSEEKINLIYRGLKSSANKKSMT